MIMFQPQNIFINLNDEKNTNDEKCSNEEKNENKLSETQNDNQLVFEEKVDKYELKNNFLEVYNNLENTKKNQIIYNESNSNIIKNFDSQSNNFNSNNEFNQMEKFISVVDQNLIDNDVYQAIKDKNTDQEYNILNDLSDLNEISQKEFANSNSELEKRIPRPPNAFMIFGQQNRKLLANQFPQYTNKQISKILGDEWRKMKLDEKSHFHRLADEAYTKHMQKYPGYYYSPLEARQRKADRKKKFFQKINSRRNYVRQQQNCSLNSDNLELPKIINQNSIKLSQLINFSNSNIFEKNENTQVIELHESIKNSNPELYGNINASQNESSNSSQTNDNANVQDIDQNNIVSSTNSIKELNQNLITTNYSQINYPIKQMCNFEMNPNFNIINNQNFNQYQNSTNQSTPNNHLICTHGMIHNNMMQRYLNFKNFTNSANEINFNNSSNNINQNRNDVFLPNSFYHHHHHHHSINNYGTPTIYHVSNKDPNLNSTMSEINANNISSTINNLNQQVFIPIQNQTLIQQSNQQQNDINSLSSFLPPMDNPSNYITPVGPGYSFEEIMIEAEKKQNQNLTKIQNQQVPLNQLNKICVKLDS